MPFPRENTCCALDRIGLREWQTVDTRALFRCRGGTEDVEGLVGRIGAYDGKILVRVEIAVPRSGRKHGNIPATYLDCSGLGASEHQACGTVGKAQNFVSQAVIVVERVNPIPPLRRPSVMGEQILVHRLTVRPGFERVAIHDDREIRIVRNPVIDPQRENVHAGGRGAGVMDPALSEGQPQPCQQGVEIASVHWKGTTCTIEGQDRQVRQRAGNHTRLKRLSFL